MTGFTRKTLLVAFCCSVWLPVFSQKQKLQRLIVSEYKAGDAGYSYVTSYNFEDGVYMSKDTIFEGPRFKNKAPYAQFSGTQTLIKDKYIVTSNGSLIDLSSEDLVWENAFGKYSFVDVIGDSLVYESHTGEKRTYFFLNLRDLMFREAAAGAYRRSKKTRIFSRTSSYANDHKELYLMPSRLGGGGFDIFLAADRSLPPEIHLQSPTSVSHLQRKSDTALVHGVGFPKISNLELSRVAAHWVDNNSFVYDKHTYVDPPGERPYHQVEIRVYRIDVKSDSLLFEYHSPLISGFPGHFSEDALGQIHYRGNNLSTYLVNISGVSGKTNPPFYLNSYFSFNRSHDEIGKNSGNTIFYKNSHIGEFWCTMPVAGQDVIALAYAEAGENLGAPKGLKIWSQTREEWTIDLPWLNSILGWIE